MIFLKIVLGVIALFIAWALLFRTHLIYTVNRWMREYTFSDQWVLFSGRRIAALLFVLGGLAIFSGVDNVMKQSTSSLPAIKKLLINSQEAYLKRNYSVVIQQCNTIIKADPTNIQARELLAASWMHMGEVKKAKYEVSIIYSLNPKYNYLQGPLSEFPEFQARPHT